jgi:methylthioribose-1-phosphate isomerase
MFETNEWTDAGVVMIDQRRLPTEEIYLTLTTPEEVADAIRTMVIRGAPAIGVAAAMGLALGAKRMAEGGADSAIFRRRFASLCDMFAATRPTAVNLFWAIERMKRAAADTAVDPAVPDAAVAGSPYGIARRLAEEAARIKTEDIASCRAIGRFGEPLVPQGANILTHCNAGALATAGYGTALGVVRAASEAGKAIRVLADETRPFLQGSRLTAWELLKDGIDTTIITDSMAGHFFRKGEITLAIVGADRIAGNGDVANKIGTYQVAVLAKENGVPFYVAAPLSTIDLSIPDGDHIPIEERAEEEVTTIGGTRMAPPGAAVHNPAFDVTPHRYITAIITDRGVARPPFGQSLRELACRNE